MPQQIDINDMDTDCTNAETGITKNPSSTPSLTPYIQSLADDLLLEIFTIFLSESKLTDYNTPLQYVLTTVCKQWRNLALSAPLLWTEIHLPLESSFNPFTHFERSKPALVDVWYDTSAHWMYDESGHRSRVLNAISTHISRLRSLTVHVWDPQEVFPIFRTWQGQEAPKLQTLSISTTHGTPSDTSHLSLSSSNPINCPDWFSGGRSLQSLNLERFAFRGFVPLPSLTSLSVDKLDTSLGEFQSLLDGCPLLATLIVRQFEMAPPSAEDSKQHIDAPSLRSLAININNNHATDCGCFLPFLSAPNLEYLEVAYLWGTLTTHHKLIFSRLTQLSKLRTLRIHSFSLWLDDVSFLASLPATTDLHIITFPLSAALSTLPYIFLSTNLKSVTLNLNYQPLDAFFDFLPDLPKPRRPFFLRCNDPNELQPLEFRLQAGLGILASVIPPSTDQGFLDDYLENQFFDNEDDRLWGLGDEDEDGLYGTDINYDFDDFHDEYSEYDDEVSYNELEDLYDLHGSYNEEDPYNYRDESTDDDEDFD
ncbi:hypothetical protein CVT25_000015 [Psilocybe cyanescens]|uniref:Uncharacterized protein n=1 Tax=Psilocybe cyanescens TaxID=93625 RepID=A0A409X8B5_PSICY|nr:hypothetical protein CVT25_000015 [Psilocybe cyanescens]